jgi:hypothetical protein
MSALHLEIVPAVTREHGEKFVDRWRDRTLDSGAMSEAFLETRTVVWPDNRLAHMRFHDIEEEITAGVFDVIRDAAVEAFVTIANEVLTRERRHV